MKHKKGNLEVSRTELAVGGLQGFCMYTVCICLHLGFGFVWLRLGANNVSGTF